MSEIKVSVVLPVYNAEKYLARCLDSILAQTLTEFELICVDDGSTDGSPAILRACAAKDARVRILTQENRFAGAARNAGLYEAAGDTVIFLDADDFFEPEMLRKAYAEKIRTDADFVVFESDQYYMDSKDYVKNPWNLNRRAIPPYVPFTYRTLTDNPFTVFMGWAWDKLYDREFILRHHLLFQEQRTSNDLLFVYSALVLAKRISVVYEVLAHQRRDGKESLSVTREKSWRCFYDALLALKDRIQKEGLWWELERDYVNYALHLSLWQEKTLAEPTKSVVREKLAAEWFAELGIAGRNEDYFYDKTEYERYLKISNSKTPVRPPQSPETADAGGSAGS